MAATADFRPHHLVNTSSQARASGRGRQYRPVGDRGWNWGTAAGRGRGVPTGDAAHPRTLRSLATGSATPPPGDAVDLRGRELAACLRGLGGPSRLLLGLLRCRTCGRCTGGADEADLEHGPPGRRSRLTLASTGPGPKATSFRPPRGPPCTHGHPAGPKTSARTRCLAHRRTRTPRCCGRPRPGRCPGRSCARLRAAASPSPLGAPQVSVLDLAHRHAPDPDGRRCAGSAEQTAPPRRQTCCVKPASAARAAALMRRLGAELLVVRPDQVVSAVMVTPALDQQGRGRIPRHDNRPCSAAGRELRTTWTRSR